MNERRSGVRTDELFERIPWRIAALFAGVEYPWEVLNRVGELLRYTDTSGLSEIGDGIYVGENVSISPTATLIGPLVIDADSEIRPGAYLRGNVYVGKGCVVGNSSEIKGSVIMDEAALPHYNYVGDSVIGYRAHMGAGAITSNLKSTGTSVVVHADKNYPTGRRKLGAMLGDHAEIGCGAVLNPGTVIGMGSIVYPLTSVRGVIPSYSVMKGDGRITARKAD